MRAPRRPEDWRERVERAGRIEFTLDGDRYEIGRLSAREWILAHLDDDPLSIFPGLLADEDADLLLDSIEDEDDPLTAQRCSDVGLTLFGTAAGWDWWEADKLVIVAIANWPLLDGPAARRGVDLLELPLDRFCAAVYSWRVEEADKKDRDEFDRWLSVPPAGVFGSDPDDVSDELAEQEAQSFLAVAGALGAS